MDKKSLLRLLIKLSEEGAVKNIFVKLRQGEANKTLHFVCDPSVDETHTVIRYVSEFGRDMPQYQNFFFRKSNLVFENSPDRDGGESVLVMTRLVFDSTRLDSSYNSRVELSDSTRFESKNLESVSSNTYIWIKKTGVLSGFFLPGLTKKRFGFGFEIWRTCASR